MNTKSVKERRKEIFRLKKQKKKTWLSVDFIEMLKAKELKKLRVMAC